MYRSLLWQKLLFFTLDCVLIVLAFVSAFYLRLGSFVRSDFPFPPYWESALLITPLWAFFLIWGEKYALREKTFGEIFRAVSLAALSSTMLFVLIFFFRQQIFFSRLIVLYIFLLGLLFGMGSFFLETQWTKFRVRHKHDILRVLVIGCNRAAQEIISALQKKSSRHVPVAILAPFGANQKEILGVPVLGKLDALERVVEKEGIQEILLCDASEQMLNLLSFAEGRFLSFQIAPEILGVFRENIAPQVLAGKSLLTLTPSPLLGWGQLWKRLFDILFSTLLLVCLAPFWLLQKILRPWKKLWYTEERIGAGGRHFFLWRSARTKRLSWQDFPNVLNIWRGEMSFVGPRPALVEEWGHLPNHFRRRLMVKPGLLGAWQLQKMAGAHDDFEAMCRADIAYLLNWSFWGDLKILGRSIVTILRGK